MGLDAHATFIIKFHPVVYLSAFVSFYQFIFYALPLLSAEGKHVAISSERYQ